MAVITLPDKVYFSKVDKLQLIRAGMSLRSRYTGKRQTVNFPFAVWAFQGTLIPMEGVDAGQWRGFLSGLEGMKNTFRLPVPGSPGPLSGYAGNLEVGVGGIGARSTTLAIATTNIVGSELVVNSAFDGTGGWNGNGGGGWNISGGKANATAAGGFLWQGGAAMTAGKTYEYTLVIDSRSAGSVQVYVGSGVVATGAISTPGTHKGTLVMGGSAELGLIGTGFTGVVDSLSIKEVITPAPANVLVLRRGDYFNLGDELKMASADVTVGPTGTAIVQFQPPSRAAYAQGQQVQVQAPFIYLAAEENDAATWSLERPVRHGIKLVCVEAI